MRFKNVVRGLACCAVLGLVVSTASARLQRYNYIDLLPGVDFFNNLDYVFNSHIATVKVYNYTNLDYLVATSSGKVTNDSGHPFVDTNQNVIFIWDADNRIWRNPTSDVYVVGARGGLNRAPASAVAVYNPLLAP